MYPQYPQQNGQSPIPPQSPHQNADAIIARAKALRDRQKMIDGYKSKQQLSNSVTWIATLVIIGLIVFFAAMNWDRLSPVVGNLFNQLRNGGGFTNTTIGDCKTLEFAPDGGLKEFPTVGNQWCIADNNRATWLLYNDEQTIDALAQEIANTDNGSDKDAIAKAIKASFGTYIIDLGKNPSSIPETRSDTVATPEPTQTEEPKAPTTLPTPVPTNTTIPPTAVEPTQLPIILELTPTQKPTATKVATPTTQPASVFNINQVPDEHPVIPVSQLKQWATRWDIPFVIMSSDDLTTRGNHCIDNQITTWPIVEFEYNKGVFEGLGYFYVDFTELQNMGYRSAMDDCPKIFSKYAIGNKNNVGFWNVVQEFDMYFAPWEKGPQILP